MALIQRRKGRAQESIRNFERSIRLDPFNVYTLQQAALSYGMLRRYAEEKLLFRRVLAIQPNDAVMKAEHAFVELDWKADSQPLHQVIDLIRTTNSDALPKIASYWLICALAERDPDSAKNALIASGEDSIWLGLIDNVPFNHSFVEGAYRTYDKRRWQSTVCVYRCARGAREDCASSTQLRPCLCVLGLIDAGLGRKEEALREGRRAVELLPVEKDELGGINMVTYLAMIAAWVDDKDLACQQLAIAIRHPNRLGYGQLKLLPFWDSLRGDPRFEKLLEESSSRWRRSRRKADSCYVKYRLANPIYAKVLLDQCILQRSSAKRREPEPSGHETKCLAQMARVQKDYTICSGKMILPHGASKHRSH